MAKVHLVHDVTFRMPDIFGMILYCSCREKMLVNGLPITNSSELFLMLPNNLQCKNCLRAWKAREK